MNFKVFHYEGNEVLINLEKVDIVTEQQIGDKKVLVFHFGTSHFFRVDSVTLEDVKKIVGITKSPKGDAFYMV